MLGLHNILLIASSSQQPQNPQTISPNQHSIANQDCNFNSPSVSIPWSLKKFQDFGDESSGGTGGPLGTCTDCGNKSKKECRFRRCRTCCKSRGYDCSTHVKSTWIPAANRRERHLGDGGVSSGSSSGGGGGGKRQKVVVTSSQNVTTTSNNSLSSAAAAAAAAHPASTHQDPSFKESLPGQVKAQAVFRCIRVTAIAGGEAEVLYQASVNIRGHVFKGLLYDQGVNQKEVTSSTNEREFLVPTVDSSNNYVPSANRKLFEGNE